MSAKSAILTTAALVVGYNLFSKKANSGKLNFYPSSVRDLGFQGVTPIATLGLAVQNPTNSSFTIRAITANVTSNGYLIGNLSEFVDQIIPSTAQTVIFLDIRLSLLSVVNDLITAFQTNNFSQGLEMKGTVNVDGFLQAIDLKYKVGN